jgi:iron(II)-dependent oxidoreductase
MRAQRDAVLRLPLLECFGAGVISAIFNRVLSCEFCVMSFNIKVTFSSKLKIQNSKLMGGTSSEIMAALRDARERTLMLVRDLEGTQWWGPKLSIVNPPLWEIGHLAWFQEHWCLRHRKNAELLPSILRNADQLYDSAKVAHDTRWDLPLPNLDQTLAYMQAVLERVSERVERGGIEYFAQLALFHEDMHGEALAYTRQTHAYASPRDAAEAEKAGPCAGDVAVAGGEFLLGASYDDRFVFDNEKWAHPVALEPFVISRAPVTNAEFLSFVEDQGYEREELWDRPGWEWRCRERATAPVYWLKEGRVWLHRRYDSLEELPPHAPVIHVNWFEAKAYCRWANRRLPTEAEWEFAAASAPTEHGKRRYPWGGTAPGSQHARLDGRSWQCADVGAHAAGDSAWGCRQLLGNVWEWTDSTFLPYPGFVVDPYQEYSQPWFGDHKVLRGGCFATRSRLLRNTWRNFYTPDRRDVFAGFRTCERTED